MVDILIRNGFVVDGTGRKGQFADVAVQSGRILRIEPDMQVEAVRTIDAAGRVVSPGFIDDHTHGDQFFLFGTDAYNLLEQGVTTEITGNCGGSIVPYHEGLLDAVRGMVPDELVEQVRQGTQDFRSFVQLASRTPTGTNMAFYVGAGNLRAKVVGFSDAKPTPAQMDEMKALVAEAMACGFLGLSSGLVYPPSVYADREELTELCRVVAAHGGCYVSHIRGECDTVVEAVAEAISIGETAGCDVVVSHHKIGGKANAGVSAVTLGLIRDANRRGRIRVLADQYPFTAGHTALVSVLDPVFATEGVRVLVEKLADPGFRRLVADNLHQPDSQSLIRFSGFDGCLIIGASRTPDCVGRTIADIASERHADPTETLFDLIVDNRGDADAAYFYQNEVDMLAILASPYTMGGSDCGHNVAHFDPETPGGQHPRAVSTFPKHLRMVRERGLFSLEEAVRRITLQPARMVGLADTGVLREGFRADLCVFDWEHVSETNDYLHPHRRNLGIDHVLVNGQIAVENGVYTGIRSGAMLWKGK